MKASNPVLVDFSDRQNSMMSLYASEGNKLRLMASSSGGQYNDEVVENYNVKYKSTQKSQAPA